jgi:hypothetical protein
VIVQAAVAACVLVPACAGTSTARPPVSLVASPAHVTLSGQERQTIRVMNTGRDAVVVDLNRAGFALDLRGRPRVVPGRTGAGVATWLVFRPRTLRIPPGGEVSLTVLAKLPRLAEPGDHSGLLLVTTRPNPAARLAVRMRIGVVVSVRAPGRIVHRLRPVGLRVRRVGRARLLDLTVANMGNVTESLAPRCLAVTLHRVGRRLATLRPAKRDLLPRSRGILELRYRGPARGPVVARVQPSGRAPCGSGLRRAFRIRL